MAMRVRPAAVAGMFYPAGRDELAATVAGLLAQGKPSSEPQAAPKVLVVPHAGYIYSGPPAAAAYRLLQAQRGKITRVVLLGPCHRVAVRGIAIPTVAAFETPLGRIPLDLQALSALRTFPFVHDSDLAHRDEHSLEVQLPFLQSVLGAFALVPLVVGEIDAANVARVLEQQWGGDDTLVVISSDLSHFLPYEVACDVDGDTAARILRLDSTLEGDAACGCRPLNGLLALARRKHLQAELLALCNSGDTAGDKRRVVGYGAFALRETVNA